MSKNPMRLHFLLLLFFCPVSSSDYVPETFNLNITIDGLIACRPHQIQAFTEFKNEFDTHGCNHSDSFNGVWCDNSTGVVTKLKLRACLSGTLKSNSSLFRFQHLRYLHLSENNFISSSLPSEFGNLNKLEVLTLSSNSFLGQVPSSFNNLSMLSFLDLSQNKLTGSNPLGRNLTNLIVVQLSHNHLSGTLNPNNSLFEFHYLRYLDLSFNNFGSSLPSRFGNLNRLEFLSLSSNGFFGQVPPTISNLTHLNQLGLMHNKFTGNFPLVQNLTKLSLLEIYDNHFSGTIPPSIFTLPSLSFLDLRENYFNGSVDVLNSSASSRLEYMYLGNNHFEGEIIEPISKLINLKELELSFLNITDPIDLNFLSSLKSLSHLILSGNSISPASFRSDSYIPLTLEVLFLEQCDIKEFPKILKTLQNLEVIDISHNKIDGKIPEWLWSLPHLIGLSLSGNLFNGFEGSTAVIVNSSVQILGLAFNRFEGALPDLPLSINFFSGAGNSFSREIPLSICSRSAFVVLDLNNNNFSGPIPQCLGNFTFVNLRKNILDGSIPDEFYAGASLRTFDVGYNRLNGKLPRSLINCSALQFLTVDYNRIEDTFPFWLKALPDLQVLILSSNKLFGPISPPHQGPLGFPELRIFEISHNKFTGSLSPRYFVNWKASSLKMNEDEDLYMQYQKTNEDTIYYKYTNSIDLQYKGLSMEQEKVITFYAAIGFSGNKLEGRIPESIGLLKGLIALNLSNNAFTGQIPLSLAYLGKLESLDLSSNQLSGTIPNGLGTLSFLEYINVSHNQLKGEIPQGTQITGQPKSSFEGNAGLCGLPLEENCFGNNAPPTQQPKEEEEEEEQVLSWKGVAIGYGAGVILGLAIAHVIASSKPEWLAMIICVNKCC